MICERPAVGSLVRWKSLLTVKPEESVDFGIVIAHLDDVGERKRNFTTVFWAGADTGDGGAIDHEWPLSKNCISELSP